MLRCRIHSGVTSCRGEGLACNLEQRIVTSAFICLEPEIGRTDVLERMLRSTVERADAKDHATDEAECVREHQAFHLAVVAPSPMRSCEERPANLDLALRFVVLGEARRSDHPSVFPVDDDERAA